MNLVFLSNGFPPRHTAGTENYTAGIASALAQAGHRVSVICVGEWDSGPQPVNGVTRDTYQGVAVARLDAGEARLSVQAAEQRLEALGYADPQSALRHLQALTSGVSRRAAPAPTSPRSS